MEFWLGWFHETNSGDQVKAIAAEAQDLGFAGVALSDHVALPKKQISRHPMRGIPYDPRTPNIEPITTAAVMTAVTDSLRVMTYAYVMGMRDPFTVAKQAGALADLSGGRVSLGITPGWNTDEIRLLGHDPQTRGERFSESIDVINGLWTHDLFSYAGKHYQFKDVGISPRPTNCPDIYIGGNSPIAIKRAARNRGWIGMNHSLDELEPLLAELDVLSEGRASKYVIATEGLSDGYLAKLDHLGIDGVVVMPWSGKASPDVDLETKIECMRITASYWSY